MNISVICESNCCCAKTTERLNVMKERRKESNS